MRVGWIMINELLTSASFSTCLIISKDTSYKEDKEGDIPVESSLIWRVVENLQELTSTQVEHELRIDREILSQLETRWIFFSVFSKLLTQSNQHPIKPPQDIGRIINLCFKDCNPSHEDGCCFLIERLGNGGMTSFVECTG
jgi:hypothetical protein